MVCVARVWAGVDSAWEQDARRAARQEHALMG